jgi:hypothetical protein
MWASGPHMGLRVCAWPARAYARLMAGVGMCAPYGWRGRVRTLWLARAPCSKITSIIRDYNNKGLAKVIKKVAI